MVRPEPTPTTHEKTSVVRILVINTGHPRGCLENFRTTFDSTMGETSASNSALLADAVLFVHISSVWGSRLAEVFMQIVSQTR